MKITILVENAFHGLNHHFSVYRGQVTILIYIDLVYPLYPFLMNMLLHENQYFHKVYFYLFQLHNADSLSDWCLKYLCNHYLQLRQRLMKQFKSLSHENIQFIEKNKWPPEW